MEDPFDTIAPIYGNIIDEAKHRLDVIRRALHPPLEEYLDYVAISDLCALQFRKTFEAVALGCLLVHGDLPGTRRLKDDTYRADKLLKGLAKLHPDFYPKPCEIKKQEKGRWSATDLQDDGSWLTKSELQRLYSTTRCTLAR